MEFIYEALELIAARYGLRDLVVVVDRGERHQLFRLRRAPLEMNEATLPAYLHAALEG